MDIYHYYPSISIDILMSTLRRKIKDERFLAVVERVVRSNTTPGLAIGFYINQWLANFNLEQIDNYIVTLPGVKHYVRNMDDMVLFGSNKKKLHKAILSISTRLKSRLDVRLKDDWQVFPVDSRAVNFVGYRFYHTHTRLRRKTFLRFTRQCRKINKIFNSGLEPSYHDACSILSRVGSLKHCDCVQARRKYYGQLNTKRIKNIVRKVSRTQIPILQRPTAAK